MLDLKLQEPKINLDFPILKHFGPQTAILYAYLKYYLETHPVELTPFKENPYYKLKMKRTDITSNTGLTEGQQIDAELGLIGAFLVDGIKTENDSVQYNFYPHNEEEVRRWCYKHINNWQI